MAKMRFSARPRTLGPTMSEVFTLPKAFLGLRPPLCEVAAAEHCERGYVMMVEVCNASTAAGALRFAPGAQPPVSFPCVCLLGRGSLAAVFTAVSRGLARAQLTPASGAAVSILSRMLR